MIVKILAAGALAAAVAMPASAATLFSDNFDSAVQGLNVGPAGWTVSNGTVDVIGTGFFEFYSGNGNYIDMDGSTYDAGRIDTASTVGFTIGKHYKLSFSYGKNGSSAETLTFGAGGWNGTLSLPSGGIGSLLAYSHTFKATAASSTIFFEAAGNDNQGPVLDNVSLAAVPLPAAGLMLLGALGMLGAARRRRS